MPKIISTEAEKLRAREQFNAYFAPGNLLPFSFYMGGEQFQNFGEEFAVEYERSESGGRERLLISAAHKSGVIVKLDAILYLDYSAYEWTVRFKNMSEHNSPVISEIKAANISFAGDYPFLHYFNGDDCSDVGYRPENASVNVGSVLEFNAVGGRPTNNQFPYYRLDFGGGGTFIVIGWSGQWSCRFDKAYRYDSVKFTAGQADFNGYLKPGEEIRTPLMAFLLYDGRDDFRAMNLWRRWFIDCNMRKVNGELMPPQLVALTSFLYSEMQNATEENQIVAFDAYADNGVKLDYWWMDAGWYYKKDATPLSSWVETGTWVVDSNRFPTAFRAVSEHLAEKNAKTMLWFEPERVHLGTYIYDEHPDWLLGGALLDLSNDVARRWLVDRVDGVLTEGKISLYRQDFNIDPLEYWRSGDRARADGRIGITENHYVSGYLAYWDELIRRHPDMMIDSCASGGRRNDLETMRRAVPLHKTDADYSNFEQKQGMHHTLFQWFPYFGTIATGWNVDNVIDDYSLRTAFVSWLTMGYDIRRGDVDWAKIISYTNEWREINGCLYGEYYPLTPWSYNKTDWIGWELFDPDKNTGFILMFRRAENQEAEKTFKLHGLDADKIYEVKDFDRGITDISGKTLMEQGYTVCIGNPRGSALIKLSCII